ncbi:hypothetical protein [Streptosporangium sandarakinum]|uniref:hypothetical protein n=1 Tax=Streptosporangium sandarakinum TaxID=1260955 RepID=UPI00371C80BE
MIPTPKPRRFIAVLLMALAAFYIVTQPEKAAAAVTSATHGAVKVADALMTFANALG